MILELLKQQAPNLIEDLSGQLGVGRNETGDAVSAAVPVLLGAMAKNTRHPQGADSLSGALDRDHDGSILDDVASFLGSSQQSAGDGILGHLLGNGRASVEGAVSQSSGLDISSVSKLFTMLAPLLMGAAGKVRREQGLDVGGLASMLQSEVRSVPDRGNLSGLMSLLDQDGDGSVVDDVTDMLGKFLK